MVLKVSFYCIIKTLRGVAMVLYVLYSDDSTCAFVVPQKGVRDKPTVIEEVKKKIETSASATTPHPLKVPRNIMV